MTKIISMPALSLTGIATLGQTNSYDKSNMDKKIFFDFVNAINEHNVDKIYSLMTDDHKFIDAHQMMQLYLYFF